MKNTATITVKELRTYFNSPIAYIFLTVFISLASWIFFKTFFINGQADMSPFFELIPWLYLFFVPAVAMRLWSEEKKQGTLEILLTLPVKDCEVVAGKFIASFIFLLLSLVLTVGIPFSVTGVGTPDIGRLFCAYTGSLLLGGAYLSIGMWASSITENQIVAFIIGVVISFLFLLCGETYFLFSLPRSIVPVFEFLGLGKHFDSISRGVLDTRDIIYYFSLIFFFLYLNVKSLEARLWRG